MPLFDRLIDDEPRRRRAHLPKTLSEEQLRESVHRELTRLLNTRSRLTLQQAETLAPDAWTVLDYGLPDMATLRSASSTDRARLAQVLAHTITAFEPRLGEVRVAVEPHATREDVLRVLVSGLLWMEKRAEPLTFALELRNRAGGPT
ncbi:type VI secretion system baseplate subunit TssE [Corallococcus exiguus]|uniref:type VI secretion system baseplate subunit TssE n=1 Tax=Corallococcus TaxID=83461 RepID=UPI001315558B|nr:MULTISPECIES: type VI secretion system baseplate subunit TssE [Corallococcus]NNB90243.1 type VI secretion system baseplate subunit TssE [Corallococcus exiguus]NNB97800.1 type VI secretion system baseplate subunit TssE [Corallococcus exiguus]NNC01654.1 type VI secretion system baseplate subunit TssE [Corallococcus exiguus]NNC20846.1 type VI secretion system baseplate subunit TssE [Corallococcus exiguus]NRD51763.1 type VI secretion system baseplate subunit TssE [Corallococcus exiguus]